VWFGEDVPNMEIAVQKVMKADFFIIIGTSLNVYPAASLLNYAVNSERVIHIDPEFHMYDGVEFICDKATSAVPNLVEELLSLSF
jgi:NAD-dependent deacetylase